jgi:hypothetical protein
MVKHLRVMALVMAGVLAGGTSLGAAAKKPAAAKPVAKAAAKPAAKAAAKDADPAAELRAEWKLGELKLTREAVEDGNFPPDIQEAAIAAVDWFLDQQEGLISKAGNSAADETRARKAQPKLEAQFRQRMAGIYDNPELMAELGRRLKALNKEMDKLAKGADALFADMESVGLTPAQKAKLKPVVASASDDVKKTVAKSASKSTKDPKGREEVVAKYKAARKKINQELTPAQREKLAKKLAEEP